MLRILFDFIFPKRCVGCRKIGSYICDNCFSGIELFQEFVCPVCLKRSITGETHPGCISPYSLDGLISAVTYKGVVKRFIYSFKFNPYLSDLTHTVGAIFTEMVFQNELFMKLLHPHPIVAVVPLYSQKRKKRGYNQSELLGGYLSEQFFLDFNPKILVRVKNTKPQFTLNKEKRFQNILQAFEIETVYKSEIKNKTVFLVDDIATSCATLRECAKVLKRNGAKKVYGVTFAREI